MENHRFLTVNHQKYQNKWATFIHFPEKAGPKTPIPRPSDSKARVSFSIRSVDVKIPAEESEQKILRETCWD